MSDFSSGVFFTVGTVASASVSSVLGGSVRHLDKLRKAAKATAGQAADVAGYRALKSSLGAVTAALRQAETSLGNGRLALQKGVHLGLRFLNVAPG